MNSKSNLNSNSLSEVCKRKEEEDPAQNEKLNPAQTAKPQPAHGHPFLFSAPGPSHWPKLAQATQPAFSSLPSRVLPSSIFLGPPFFPHGPACPHLPLALQRAPPSHQRPRARLPATLTRPRCPTRAAPAPHALWPSPRTQPLPLPPQTARPALPPRAQPGRIMRAPLLSRASPDAPAHLFRSLTRTACSRSCVTPRLTPPASTHTPASARAASSFPLSLRRGPSRQLLRLPRATARLRSPAKSTPAFQTRARTPRLAAAL